jgi:hypothetical protein
MRYDLGRVDGGNAFVYSLLHFLNSIPEHCRDRLGKGQNQIAVLMVRKGEPSRKYWGRKVWT